MFRDPSDQTVVLSVYFTIEIVPPWAVHVMGDFGGQLTQHGSLNQ